MKNSHLNRTALYFIEVWEKKMKWRTQNDPVEQWSYLDFALFLDPLPLAVWPVGGPAKVDSTSSWTKQLFLALARTASAFLASSPDSSSDSCLSKYWEAPPLPTPAASPAKAPPKTPMLKALPEEPSCKFGLSTRGTGYGHSHFKYLPLSMAIFVPYKPGIFWTTHWQRKAASLVPSQTWVLFFSALFVFDFQNLSIFLVGFLRICQIINWKKYYIINIAQACHLLKNSIFKNNICETELSPNDGICTGVKKSLQ